MLGRKEEKDPLKAIISLGSAVRTFKGKRFRCIPLKVKGSLAATKNERNTTVPRVRRTLGSDLQAFSIQALFAGLVYRK